MDDPNIIGDFKCLPKEIICTILKYSSFRTWCNVNSFFLDLSYQILTLDQKLNALQRASNNGHVTVIDRLLQDQRVDPSVMHNSAIQGASRYGHLTVVERLVEPTSSLCTVINGDCIGDPIAKRKQPMTIIGCFRFAIGSPIQSRFFLTLLRLLQDQRVDPSDDDNYAIRWASLYGHLNVMERLLQDQRVDPSANNNSAIKYASEFTGDCRVIDRLLQDQRVDPSAEDNYAIRWASLNGHLNAVNRLLQDQRVDPSADNNSAFFWASNRGHLSVVDRLLQDSRVDPSAEDNKALKHASRNGRLHVIERLLQDPRVAHIYDNDHS